MEINDYTLNDESKMHHALDSFAFTYHNLFGNKDNLKIEINYMNRVHIYKEELRDITISFLNVPKALTLNVYELYGSKIKALLERCTIRDVYDVYHMISSKLFSDSEYQNVKKCVIFYMAIGNTSERSFNDVLNDFEGKINAYMLNRIPQYLSSTLRKGDTFSLVDAVKEAKDFIQNFMELTKEEEKFIRECEKGNYHPEILFDDKSIVDRIKNHPMALWKKSSR